MKTMLKMIGIGILSGWLLGTPRASADVSVSAGILINSQADFEAPLAASGTWVTVGTYGR
jgi:hypothetical protein